ncbi:alpha/beta hydrolase [Dyadobacter luteus]|jgi:pimeloyl-ACP methyl ester carboxylesterase|uniref:Alpha/beta hydrolase n=2 Tax=Dyadobacter luteus TaxID=2259619 RepID=A0A3D8YEY8_9BACT|nr:alpha/beta hydrolase [Dyadobacter luteus]
MFNQLLITLLLFSVMNPVFGQAKTGKSLMPAYGSNGKVGKYANIRGFKMYYEVYGKGSPVLMIHGNGGSISDFRNQIGYFSKNYKVIVADSRAQGKSVDVSDSLSYEMMADDYNALLTELHVDSCHVIGWSDGGINGLLLAKRNPKKVKKLAITGANLWPDTTALEPFLVKWIGSGIDSLNSVNQSQEVKAQKKLLNLMAFNPNISIADLKSVICPTLVIGGDNDVILPRHTMLIAEALPKSYLWILPDAGHSTLVVYKDVFNSVVEDFFKKPYRKEKGAAQFE